MYLEAVKRNGLLLDQIPYAYRSYELCLAAIMDYSDMIEIVPDEIKTYYKNITLIHYTEFLKYKGVGEDKIPLLIKNID